MFFCLPIVFGCPTQIKPDKRADQTPRVCPICHNAAVQAAKARTWFELCFVPLVPMKSHRVWICPICNWRMNIQDGWQPQVAGNYQPPQHDPWLSMSPDGNPQNTQPGYQPGYHPGYQPYPPNTNPHQKTQ